MMRGNKIFNFIFEYEQKVFVILFFVLIVGMAWGSFSLVNDARAGELSATFAESAIQLFENTIIKNLLILLVTFLLGYTVIGFPFLCFSVLYHGICTGIFISLFSVTYGIKGCVISSVIFFPYYLTLILSLLYVTFSSIRLSVALYNVFKDGTRYISPKAYSKPHIVKFAFFTAITVAVSFLYNYFVIPIAVNFF